MEHVIRALREKHRTHLDQAFHARAHAEERRKQANDLDAEAVINADRAGETAAAIKALGGEVPEWIDPVERKRRAEAEKQAAPPAQVCM